MAKSKLIPVSCPKCGKIYRIYPENIGRSGICKKCSIRFSMLPAKKTPVKKTINAVKPVVRSAPPTEAQSKVKAVIPEATEQVTQKSKRTNTTHKKDTIHSNTRRTSPPKITNISVAKKDLNVLAEQIKVLVTDGMKAYLTEKTLMDSDVTIEDIKKFLEHEKIVNGIVDDEEIQKFIDKRLNRIKPFLIAEGSEPTSPQHGRIRYFFDTQPLKKIDPNLVDEKDRIDFKERGEMPYVEKGTLIAERVPGIPGKHGKDVYGKRIEAKKAKHVTLRCGNGAILSEDKRMVHARIDGLPVTTSGRNERIDVLPHFYISGDVNMKTGNVRFNGPVIVKGTVQNGFKVRCATLEAKELFRADIRADGDILVQGGVVGTQVVCNGSFKAKFVKGSTIQSDGLVVVSNGIVDSKVDTRENCIVENNKILTSDIMALKNIETQDLGSKSSPGCQLTIGVDPILIKELTRLTDENKSLEKQLETSMEELDIDNLQELNDDYQSVVEKIDQLEPPLKEAKTINHTLIKKYKAAKKQNNQANKNQILETIKTFSKKIGPAQEELISLNHTRNKMKASLDLLQGYHQQIEKNTEDIQTINRNIQTVDHPAKVIVHGEVFPGTMINGSNASMEILKKQSNVMFEEIHIYNDNNLPEKKIDSRPINNN